MREHDRRSDIRGQTAQDFAVGISVFIVTVALVLAYVPTAVFPFTQGTQTETASQADRLADSLVADFAREGALTDLEESSVDAFFVGNDTSEAIRTNYSLPATASVNVTIEHPDGTPVAAWDAEAGVRYADQDASVASRLVALDGDRYRLVVRVW
jgi:hypothetical protein